MKDKNERNEKEIVIKCDGLVQTEYIVKGNYKGRLYGPELEFFVVDKETFKPKDCLDRVAGLSCFWR